MRTFQIAVLCLLLGGGPAWSSGDATAPAPDAGVAVEPIGVVKTRKVKLQEPPGKPIPIPKYDNAVVKPADRVPGGKSDCALSGDSRGPDGCTILKQDRNHYEKQTIE